ncbi:hypothetical protein C6P76_29335 [Burkholderia multivorans]|uniref:hypothetical protein n=1 Tax=Burkholderia multivorans TaxID=87883 RepID=UPI000CFECACC|nr:hypothetical protein [Burkholderia multivorans]PRD80479.1 hypothetical protein C6P76_29335 [Burkholderia multivorans]
MNKINDGGPAFPATWVNDSDLNAIAPNGQVCPPFSSIPLPGMSLRDYFAAKALTGLLAEPVSEGVSPSSIHCTPGFDAEGAQPGDRIAAAAYALADAMLRARGAA